MKFLDNTLFWKNGTRVILIIFFTFSILVQLIHPSNFFIIVRSLDIYVYAPEFLLATIIVLEAVLVYLLVSNPNRGIYFTAYFFLSQLVVIGFLNFIGIRELCGDDDVVTKVLGISNVLKSSGASLLLFSLHYLISKNQ